MTPDPAKELPFSFDMAQLFMTDYLKPLLFSTTKPYEEALTRAKVALIVFQNGVVLTDTRADLEGQMGTGGSHLDDVTPRNDSE